MSIDLNKVPIIDDMYNYLQNKKFDKKYLVKLKEEFNIIYKQKIYCDGNQNYGIVYFRCPIDENKPKEPIGVIK